MKKPFKHIFLFAFIVMLTGALSLTMFILSKDIEPEFRPVEREISLEQLSSENDV